MHSSAQATFSARNQSLLALLDTEAGLQVAASPLEVDFVQIGVDLNIIGTTPINFMIWPMAYLQVDMVDATTFHVTEFDDAVVASDLAGMDLSAGPSSTPLGEFLEALTVSTTLTPDIPVSCKDTVYPVAAGSRTIHKPTKRYQVLWIAETFVASGAVRATQAGRVGTASAIPAKYPYYWSLG